MLSDARRDAAAVRHVGVINPMMMLLRDADSLRLTGVQADSIATLNRAYMVRLNAIWAPVSSYYVARGRRMRPLATAAPAAIRRARRWRR